MAWLSRGQPSRGQSGMRRPMRIPFSDPGERHYMSIMINEAQSSNIATIYLKIESIENLEKNCTFYKMHPIQPNDILFQTCLKHILTKSGCYAFLTILIPYV